MVQTSGRRVLVVTPAFNAADYIDDAICSVITQQATDRPIHYHVQDGGSGDGTVDKLRLWQQLLDSGVLLGGLSGVRFSYASQSDGGMYDAVQKGFDRLRPADGDILTWINCDDTLAQGGIATVAQVFDDVPGCEFLSGRIALLNQAGAVIVLGQATPYARADLAQGLHDGRTLPFVMQEGTFFSGRLWNAVGGVDTRFRLAGDWDLWRRMAAIADHFLVDSITGFHRRRPGQLSGDLVGYYREIDAAREAEPAGAHRPGGMGTVVRYDLSTGQWTTTTYDKFRSPGPALLRDGRSVRSAKCGSLAGFGFAEGPFPEHALPAGVRWMTGAQGEIGIYAPTSGRYRVRVTLRVIRSGVVLAIAIDAREPFVVRLDDPAPFVNQVVETTWWLEEGQNSLVLDCGDQSDPRTLLLVDCEAVEADEREAVRALNPPADGAKGEEQTLAILIVCLEKEPELLERSIAGCERLVVAGAALFVAYRPQVGALRLMMDHWSAILSGCFPLAHAADGDMAAIRSNLHEAGFRDVLLLHRGTLVVEGGLVAAMAVLDQDATDAAYGLVETPDWAGGIIQLDGAARNGPVLFRDRTGSGGDLGAVRLGCALARRPKREIRTPRRPVVWLIDDDRPTVGRTPAIILGGALKMLGHDVRFSTFSKNTRLRPSAGTPVISSNGCAADVGASATVTVQAGVLRLQACGVGGGPVLDLPLVADTDQLLPRDRLEARHRLGWETGAVMVCIAESACRLTDMVLARLLDESTAPIRVINLGAPATAGAAAPLDMIELDAAEDLTLLSYVLSAADAAVTASREPSFIGLAAWSCGLPLFDLDGVAFPPRVLHDERQGETVMSLNDVLRRRPFDRKKDLSARNLMVGTRSMAALALALDGQGARLPELIRSEAPPHDQVLLQSGRLVVRSYTAAGTPGPPYRAQNAGTLIPLKGATLLAETADTRGGIAIAAVVGTAVLCIDEHAGSGLRLHLRGTQGATWNIEVAGKTQPFTPTESGGATLYFAGKVATGPSLCRFVWTGEGFPPHPLCVTGWEITGAAEGSGLPTEGTIVSLRNAAEQEVEPLEIDGDWRRVAGFRDEEPCAPQAGLHTRFRWSVGRHCTLRMRVGRGGWRKLQVALSGAVHGQRVRPVIAGKAYRWCEPLRGPIGHVEYREWLIRWKKGDHEFDLEMSDVLRTPDINLGVILFAIYLE